MLIPRVLVVDDDSKALKSMVRLLNRERRELEVHSARAAVQALDLCAERGPFTCVFSGQSLSGSDGVELLECVGARWPDTARVLMTAGARPALAAEALRGGGVTCLIEKPFVAEQVVEVLDAAVDHIKGVEHRRVMTEQLLFTRETLMEMTAELERRLIDEMHNLASLQDLSTHLSASCSLVDVAHVSATAISNALDGRAVRVELENPYRSGEYAAACAQGEPAVDPHVEEVQTDLGALGRITVEGASSLVGRDLRVLGSLVSSASLAAHSQIRRFERDEAQHATVFAMARLAERRDNETGKHLARVSEYCRLIACGLREDGHHVEAVTDGFIEDLVCSAPLHDIGKVGIPDRILLKSAKLDKDEWEIMKGHTVIGGDTLRSIIESTAQPGFLLMGHDIALYHHERWNGSGYPNGLSGEDIPLCARIVALADVYDALTTQRPYKSPWPHERALAWIEQESGSHFEPAVVRAFLDRAAQVERIRVSLADADQPDLQRP